MKNKGFTLIELLAVIAILGILFTILMPKVLNVIEGSERNSFVKSTQLILAAASKYMGSDERELPLPVTDGKGAVITLDILINKDFIKKNDKYDGSVVVVFNNNDSFEYYAFVSDGTYSVNGYRSGAINNNATLFVSPIAYETLLESVEDFSLDGNGQLSY